MWRKIRQDAREASGGTCDICGEPERTGMICHEEWEYEDAAHVAVLTRFRWICPDCNGVIHIGGGAYSYSGDLQRDPGMLVLEHMIAVNGMDLDQATAALIEANHAYDERSSHEWSVRLSDDVIQRYPFLMDVSL